MAEFIGYAQGGSFNPNQVTDITGDMKSEYARQTQAYNNYIAGFERNAQVELQNAKQKGKGLEALGELSGTLAGMAEEKAQKNAERDQEEGMMMAYMDGVPEDVMAGFDLQEKEVKASNAATQSAGAEVEKNTGNAPLGQRVRDMSGWKQYGYAMGLAQMGGINYPAFYATAKETVSVTINGKQVTYASAADTAERAAVEAEIRRQYLSKYSSINPVLLNKYLFSQMRTFEAKEAQEWAQMKSAQLKQERQEQAKDKLYADYGSGNGGQGMLDFIEANKGELGYKGAREAAFENLQAYLQDDTIPLEKRQEALDNVRNQEFVRNDGHKTTLGAAFGRDFGKAEQALNNAENEVYSRKEAEKARVIQQYEDAFYKQVAAGKKFNNEEIRQFKARFTALTGMPAPQFYDTYTTIEESSQEQEELILKQKMASRPGGYITSADLEGMSVATRAKYNRAAQEGDSGLAPDQDTIKKRNRNLRTWTNEKTAEQVGTDDSGSRKWNTIYDNAERAWNQEYANAIQDGATPSQAVAIANKEVQDAFKFGPKGEKTIFEQAPSATIPQQQAQNFDDARKFLLDNPTGYTSQVIPGTENDLKALIKYRDTGSGGVPLIYDRLSQGYKNMTGYDFANAQLIAAGEKPMGASAPESTTISPAAQELLKFKHTVKRTKRATTPVDYNDPASNRSSSNPTTVIGASGYRGTDNVIEVGQKDYKGRPIKFAPTAAAAWKQMIAAGMPVNPNDVANAYRDEQEYLRLRAEGFHPAADSHHNHGTGVDCHGAQGAWIRANGAAFGWYPNDYQGSHGGHFEFRG